MHPSPTSDGDNWRITEDKDHINLKFNVGESTRKDKLEVATADQVLLTVRYTGSRDEDTLQESQGSPSADLRPSGPTVIIKL